MVYRFEYRTAGKWHPIGTGEGAGANPVRQAIESVARDVSDDLPAGEYRYLVPMDAGSRWRRFDITEDGALIGL